MELTEKKTKTMTLTIDLTKRDSAIIKIIGKVNGLDITTVKGMKEIIGIYLIMCN